MPTGVYEREEPIVRFWSKVVQDSITGCWIWVGCLNGAGYGQIGVDSKVVLAHRWSFEYFKHKISKRKVIDHLCRNSRCVNPSHLDCVTMGENTRRGNLHKVIKAKWKAIRKCKRGHPFKGENLYIDKRGRRMCKTCQKDAASRWKIANRNRVNEKQRQRRKTA